MILQITFIKNINAPLLYKYSIFLINVKYYKKLVKLHLNQISKSNIYI
jgi:hypothetical protein